MNSKTVLRSVKKKTIGISELRSLMRAGSDAELFDVVSDAVNSGILSPVKASGTNGNLMYPVYLKYRILADDDMSAAVSEISMLHPSITQNGYLKSRPGSYQTYKDQLQKLNRYLFNAQPSVSISKKERSFEIFGEEKQLDDNAFRSLLDRLGLTSEILHYYETPEYCFNDFIPERLPEMTLLICENKDIWFNIRRRMYEDSAGSIFGTHIDGVVYGCGNRISEAGALSAYTGFMCAESVDYLYWGDVDRAGLDIYLSLVKSNPGLSIRLFVQAYEEMLHLAEDREILDSSDHRGRIRDYRAVYELFSEASGLRLSEYIEANKRIPQEIISYETLLNAMR